MALLKIPVEECDIVSDEYECHSGCLRREYGSPSFSCAEKDRDLVLLHSCVICLQLITDVECARECNDCPNFVCCQCYYTMHGTRCPVCRTADVTGSRKKRWFGQVSAYALKSLVLTCNTCNTNVAAADVVSHTTKCSCMHFCPICSKVNFTTFDALKIHLAEKHGEVKSTDASGEVGIRGYMPVLVQLDASTIVYLKRITKNDLPFLTIRASRRVKLPLIVVPACGFASNDDNTVCPEDTYLACLAQAENFSVRFVDSASAKRPRKDSPCNETYT